VDPSQPRKMINVTKIEILEKGIKRYILFYSLTQFASWLATLLLVIFLFNSVVLLIGFKDILSGAAIAVGMLCSLPAVAFARQASFKICGPSRLQAYAALQGRLDATGLQKTAISPKEIRYKYNFPKFLQWEKNHLTFLVNGDNVMVIGPYGVLMGFKKFLIKNFGDR
jgi:hypothetical protein